MKKLLCIAVALLMCMSVMASCSEKDDNGNSSEPASTAVNSGESTAQTSDESESGDESSAPDIIVEDFNDADFTILSVGGDKFISEILPNELTDDSESWLTEAVNSAIAERNRKTEALLNVNIKELAISSGRVGGEILTYIRNEIVSSNHTFDVCAPSIYDCGTLAAEGSFQNLMDIPSINTENPWWDQSFNESMTINGCLYFTLGDIGVVNKNATPVVYFNKTLAQNNGIDPSDLYQLVRDNKWTFDKAYEYAKLLSIDEDNSGSIDYKDTVGWAGQADDTWNFFFASGERIVSQDAEGSLMLSIYNTRSVNVAENMYNMFRDKTHYISANNYFGDSGQPTYDCTGNAFIEGRVMFFSDNMAFMHFFASMDDDFGVLPTPKYDDNQDSYFSLINPWTGNAFAIPNTLTDEQAYFAGAVLDVMGYYSVDTVAYEYVQRTLKYQKARDDDSIDMLQLIYDTRGCDIGIIYNIGNSSGTSLPAMLQKIMSSPSGTFTSSYESIADAAQQDLDAVIELYGING